MNKKREWILALDTSNYTTSLAAVDREGRLLADLREGLSVPEGGRGLRQSDALFQHMEHLPVLVERAFRDLGAQGLTGKEVAALSVSFRPRPVPGSYMPVFLAGENLGRSLAATLNVPLFRFSHQEGHLAAAIHEGPLAAEKRYLAYHLSGGTCELLLVENGRIQIIGGTKDLSMGQVLDRVGVTLGFPFPAGKALDELALSGMENSGISKAVSPFKPVAREGLWINLSGLETRFQQLSQKGAPESEELVFHLFCRLSSCLVAMTEEAVEETGCSKVLFTGGVASSSFLRNQILSHFQGTSAVVAFGNAGLSSDNAVGIARLGRNALWP